MKLYNGNYIQFYSNGNEALGSDGVSPFDGRLSKDLAINMAYDRLAKIKAIKPSYNGFVVYRKGIAIYSRL